MVRFLRNSDYYRFIQQKHFDQLIAGNNQIIIDSEEDAKEEIISYLTNEYEVEAAFQIGLDTRDFSVQKETLKGDNVWVNDKLYQVQGYLNPARKPGYETYWNELADEVFDPLKTSYSVGDYVEYDNALYQLRYEGYVASSGQSVPNDMFWILVSTKVYSQDGNYEPTDIVKYKGGWYECAKENGDLINEVVQPFFNPWINQNLVDFTTIVAPVSGDLGVDTNDFTLVEYVSGAWQPKQFFEFAVGAFFKPTDYVRFNNEFYLSKMEINPKGRLHFFPGLTQFWNQVAFNTFDPGFDYSASNVGLIVSYNDAFYELFGLLNIQAGIAPDEASANWKAVTVEAYDETVSYAAGAYVAYEGVNYQLPGETVMYVNAATFENNKIEFKETTDPRNKNLIRCMVHIALYCIHQRIAPDHVPAFRIKNYDDTMHTLKCYSKLTKDPSISRKLASNGKLRSDWVVADTGAGAWDY
ncbi:MAG: hypothetical protein AAF620_00065 [Bacteroidota bacterium]